MPAMREYEVDVMLDSMWRMTDAANWVNDSRTSEVQSLERICLVKVPSDTPKGIWPVERP